MKTEANLKNFLILMVVVIILSIIAIVFGLHIKMNRNPKEEKAKEITFNLYDYNWELENCSYEKNVGVVTTREEAIGKAKELWKERYGNIIKINDSPVAVAYDSQNECWRVNGTFPDDDNINVDGAVPCAIIRKNGEVLALWIG